MVSDLGALGLRNRNIDDFRLIKSDKAMALVWRESTQLLDEKNDMLNITPGVYGALIRSAKNDKGQTTYFISCPQLIAKSEGGLDISFYDAYLPDESSITGAVTFYDSETGGANVVEGTNYFDNDFTIRHAGIDTQVERGTDFGYYAVVFNEGKDVIDYVDMKLGDESVSKTFNVSIYPGHSEVLSDLAIVCRDDKGEWMIINGNQTAMMFCYYIIENKKKLGKLKPTDFLVKTIVTTEVIAEIAKKNNVELRDCYTGFKWIAREIAISEGKQQYIGGGEESFGFLPYDKVRDKDAPASICLICEIAAWAKDQGKTLYDLLMQIYAEYGFSKEFTVNVVRPGKTGADEIKQMMADFRANPPRELGGSKVVTWKDYQTLEEKHADGSVEKLNMPTTSNVLQWFCDDNTKVSVRPSGTEPKIKFYIEVKDPSFKCAGCYNRCTAAAMEKIEAIKKSLNLE